MKKTAKILLAIAGAFLILLLALLVYALAVTRGVSLDESKLTLNSRTVCVFDKDGAPLDGAERGDAVSIDALPDYLPNAFVAVEDKRFYSHGGLDYRRMVKAALKNLTSFSFREGASTISQQLVKNTHLTSEKTIVRKLREIKLARALEKRYGKRQILELYLNSIYFGHSAFGLGEAARFYFGKQAEALTPAESAMLAALVRSPNRYSPFKHPEACLARRNYVLSLMKDLGMITAEEAEEGARESLPEKAGGEGENPYLALVYDELSSLFPDAASGDRLKVYTYFDGNAQSALPREEEGCDKIVLVRDVKSDGIKAFFSTCGLPNRLPASVIKPLAVYAPALEENLVSPATPLLDEKTDFNGYSPSDYGGRYGGYMSVRYALAHSVNVPAVKLLNALGCDRAAGYLEALGLPVPQEDRTLALALGGMREGYPLTRLADGYAALVKGGLYRPSGTIRKVEDEKGRTLYSAEESADGQQERGKRVFSEDVASLTLDMLKTAVREGTAKKLRTLPFEVCAKTGTGGSEGGNTDVYTIACTTEDVVAVWLGNRDNSPVKETGGGRPAAIARDVLSALYPHGAPPAFAPSQEVVRLALDREEYETRHGLLLADELSPDCLRLYELFRASAVPTAKCDKFSHPTIEKPQITVADGRVCIVLCQTKYYDYVVKRECEGQITTIYSGKYRRELFDNSVCGGKRYIYSVTPIYRGVEGETVVLPAVFIQKSVSPPDEWWREGQSSNPSFDSIASRMSASTSSFFSSSSMKESLGLIAGNSGKKTVQQSS